MIQDQRIRYSGESFDGSLPVIECTVEGRVMSKIPLLLATTATRVHTYKITRCPVLDQQVDSVMIGT